MHTYIHTEFRKETKVEAVFKYCELFAGIGGFGLGLQPLGGVCVFASELEPEARQVSPHV